MTRVLWNSKSSCLDLIPKHLLEKQSEKNVADDLMTAVANDV